MQLGQIKYKLAMITVTIAVMMIIDTCVYFFRGNKCTKETKLNIAALHFEQGL